MCEGGSVSLTYSISDICSQDSVSATFTIMPSAPVDVAGPSNVSSTSCDYSNQAAVDSSFANWLSQFHIVNMGCAVSTNGGSPAVFSGDPRVSPNLCTGGSVTATYSISDNCSQDSVSATFTITPSAPVAVTGPSNVSSTSCDYTNQSALDASFASWMSQFQTLSSGCGAQAQFSNTEFQTPRLCEGGSVTLTYNIADHCSQDSVTSTFTVTPSTPVTVGTPQNATASACSYADQGAVNAAFTSWLSGFTVSGGCSPVGVIQGQPTAPTLCQGGTTTVTYTVNDKCYTGTRSATFTITTPTVTLTCGNDVTLPSCSTQAQINSAWTNFLASTTVSGGCANGTLVNNAPTTPPSSCGGYVDVTWNYNVSNPCSQSVGCQGQFKTFTIGGWGTSCNGNNPGCYRDSNFSQAFPNGLTIGYGSNVLSLTSSLAVQEFLPSGGSPALLSGTSINPGSSIKNTLASQLIALTLAVGFDIYDPNFSASTVNFGSLQILSGPYAGMTVSSFLSYANKVIGGNVQGSLSDVNATATSINENFDNGTVDKQFLNCGGQSPASSTVSCTKRFTITATPAVTFTCGSDVTVPSCSSQSQINSAWTAFLASTNVSGGCSNGILTNNAPTTPPSACGGYVDVTWTYRSGSTCGAITCGSQTNYGSQSCTKRFTVVGGGLVDVSGPSNVSYNGCSFTSQSAVNCAFADWLSQFKTISSGCSTTITSGCGSSSAVSGAIAVFSGDPRVAPNLTHGGSVRVTYSITGSCNQDSVCATFTLAPRTSSCNTSCLISSTGMDVKVSPNPYSENFKVNVTTSNEDKVKLSVYDMTGRLVEAFEVNPSDLINFQVGDQYPSGVYNLIVTQGDEVKTLRVIKR